MKNILIDFKDYWDDNPLIPESDRWLAWFVDMPGMVVSGSSKQNAFDELLISLRVKILYDNNRITFDLD